jgi:hypothetical protein
MNDDMNVERPPFVRLLISVFGGFVLVNLGYFLVPYTAGDFAIRAPNWLVAIGRGLIFPLLLSDSGMGFFVSVAIDAFLVFLFLSAIHWVRLHKLYRGHRS